MKVKEMLEQRLEPNIINEVDEIDEYIESQIVIWGELTSYGEEMYEESKEQYYDEVQQKWISL